MACLWAENGGGCVFLGMVCMFGYVLFLDGLERGFWALLNVEVCDG